jgi:DNA-directed RNA polymerase subunit RPC12/RpoP
MAAGPAGRDAVVGGKKPTRAVTHFGLRHAPSRPRTETTPAGVFDVPIKFRCTGCKSKLYVPARWHGTSIECPRCQTRVMVPAEAVGGPGASFEGRDVERSLADLLPPSPPPSPAVEDAFELAPFSVKVDRKQPSRGKSRSAGPGVPVTARASLTIPRWAPYACLVTLVLVAVGGFLLGAWWATRGSGS